MSNETYQCSSPAFEGVTVTSLQAQSFFALELQMSLGEADVEAWLVVMLPTEKHSSAFTPRPNSLFRGTQNLQGFPAPR
jgi:hypothetical protein